jgi:hypothetical protein
MTSKCLSSCKSQLLNAAGLVGLCTLLLLSHVPSNLVVNAEEEPQQFPYANTGSITFKEISRQSDPLLAEKGDLAVNDNNLFKVTFLEQPPASNTGSDSFSEISREPVGSNETIDTAPSNSSDLP